MPAFASSVVVLTDQQPAIIANTQLDFLHDPEGRLTINQVISAPLTERFNNTGTDGFYVGLSYDTYWLRQRFDHQSSSLLAWYLQVLGMDEAWVEVYLQQGQSTPVRLNPKPYFFYHTYPLVLPAQGGYTVYARVQDRNDGLGLGFRFTQAEQRIDIHNVIFYTLISGGLLALGLYNLFLFVSLRHASYGWLGLGILAINLENSRYTGLLHQYLPIWPEYFQIYSIFGFVSLLGYIPFFRNLLATRNYFPILDKAFQVLFWVILGVLVNLAWLPFAALWYTVLAALVFILTALTIFRVFFSPIRINKKLAWGFVAFILGAVPALLNGLYIQLDFVFSFSTLLLTIFLFVLMLSLAQADHVRLLREEAASANASNKAKGDFLTTMSHELRTPMNAVVGAGDLLRDTRLTVQQRSYVDKLEIASRHMLTLIGNILDVSRIEQQALSFEQIPFDLKALANELEALFVGQAQEKGLVFSLQAPTTALWLQGDPTRLKQVLMNLLSNAIKFTERGQVDCRIQVEEEDAQTLTISFTVTDTGIGITPEQQAHLFQPFSQADSSTSRRYGGSGLGLVISAQLLRRMGGALSLESSLGQGSRLGFRLKFPVANPLPTAPTMAFNQRVNLNLPAAAVLLVDDDLLNQFFTQAVLEKFGMQVTVVDSGLAALQQIQQQDFALVLMDVSMPEMDGYETTRRIRACPNRVHLPIIALTAHAIAGERERCLAAGMDDFLCKPYQMIDLKMTLQRWLLKA